MTTPQVLGERYEIGGVLGRGGMAEVHRGRDLRLGREVAVKVLRQDLARDPSSQVRFRREAQAAASLNHPAIVAVYDTGEDRTATGATPYIVMEYVEGETLRDLLRTEGRLPPERAMSLTADICAALDFSHRNGIVHRDVKPGNVMITPQGTVKVMDFGIARAVSDSAATMTSTAAVIGTAQYLSPEQARGEGVDARSDVYSAGCLLYELATGTPPFTGDSPVAVAYQHVREDPRTPSSINPEIPPALDAILLKAMSKNPANRYQSAADMRADLLRAIAGQRVEATPVMSDADRTTIIGATSAGRYDDQWDEQDDGRRKRRTLIAAVIGGLLLLGLVIAGIVVLNSGGDREPTTPAVVQVAVPNVVGQTEEAATTALTSAGLTVGEVTEEASPTVVEGQVVRTDPASGTQLAERSPVALVVSAGPDSLAVPDLAGRETADARDRLEAAGFTGSISTDQVDSLQPEGTVVESDPPAGTQADPDADITLKVSTGTIDLPDVRGLTAAAARERLISAGIDNGLITEFNREDDTVAAGSVIDTDPGPRSPVSAEDPVELQIAVPVPVEEPAPSSTPASTSPAAPTTTPPASSAPATSAPPGG
ncbi:Stk1 family PASTA domain-containing Ser/Thr kinase [Modestobacter muralis]|uniref:non-specific serine/threonine protein kinase n=1 Tax=Modestobacter muralis TaxID=1608614 RepID=A0A6P0H757_9ACTN|nr:Stk1 family PASTA domain-containing Ser/Thr kinase [Modestobacter muralis]NEK93819.1 Stk1 family PASTA domain-containing Ser/Thr kinase [Modestobacter muralis]NEN50586.1 Stk1 family PASTA domain-containing Ser/Thr kinase [Modestobacter muralis]